MSIKLMSLVWDRLDVSGGELTLALALADFANDEGGSIWPSVDTLSFKTRQGERTVRRQLARFRDLKWLEIVKAGGGAGQTNLYRINPEWIKGAELAGFPSVTGKKFTDEKGANLAGLPEKTLPSTTENPAIHDKNPVTAVTTNPSRSTIKPLSAPARAIPSGSRGAKDPDPPDPVARAWFWRNRAWNVAIADAALFGMELDGQTIVVSRGTPAVELPRKLREELKPTIETAGDAAATEEIDEKLAIKVVEDRLADRVQLAMKAYRPATASQLGAASADPFEPPLAAGGAR